MHTLPQISRFRKRKEEGNEYLYFFSEDERMFFVNQETDFIITQIKEEKDYNLIVNKIVKKYNISNMDANEMLESVIDRLTNLNITIKEE